MEDLARKLRLQRDLVFFDLESTGIDPRNDRIVEIAGLKLRADGGTEMKSLRLNPGRPIPKESSAIHGITDDDVRHSPSFEAVAPELRQFFEGADLAGFNLVRFDIPLLTAEFERVGYRFSLLERRVIDTQTIFHKLEPRTLVAAFKLYVGRDLSNAHSAAADACATAEVLAGQLARYPELPADVDALDAFCREARGGIDLGGRLFWQNGEAVLAFGKHRGKPLKEVAKKDRGWLEWVAGPDADFLSDFKDLCAAALAGRFPQP
jgi:DNA polymerase-3 subunit epsilon